MESNRNPIQVRYSSQPIKFVLKIVVFRRQKLIILMNKLLMDINLFLKKSSFSINEVITIDNKKNKHAINGFVKKKYQF